MNLTISGHHIEVTDALRDYVQEKMKRILRHFDHVTSAQVVLSVARLKHCAEVTIHVKGKDICAKDEQPKDLYAAIDGVADKLDRQVLKYKEKNGKHLHERHSDVSLG